MARERPDFDDVRRAFARLQALVPDAVLVGGSAAAARHADADHVVVDLVERFDDVLAALEDTDGWVTARVRRPVLVLGSLDGIETGVRNLIRRQPLEVEEADIDGSPLRVPTLEEITRVKAWMVLVRYATRDYLDLAALADRLGERQAAAVLLDIDDYYEDQVSSGGRRVATQLARQLAEPAPYDLSEIDLAR